MQSTLAALEARNFSGLRRQAVSTLQVNLGYRCNQTCSHCHVNAGPTRKERMDEETLQLVVRVLKARSIETLDLTGGAPELHPGFRRLVQAARQLGLRVIDRSNLTILFEPGQEDLAEFLAEQEVEIVASLPCYTNENVDRQRGQGVFEKSIAALQRLNALGYGLPGSRQKLYLVYNPLGPTLPPKQQKLEQEYRRELFERFGIVFNGLYTLTNMPIQRFGAWLLAKGALDRYLDLLEQNHRESNLERVMCRTLVSVDWQGYLYDCDFNQQLGLPLGEPRRHLRDLLQEDLWDLPVRVAGHCFGCTAGYGSSCGGALEHD